MSTSVSRRSMLGLVGATSLAVTALAATPGVATAAVSPHLPAPDLRDYERLVADLAAQDQFSGTVLLARKGRPALVRSYGLADQGRSIANQPDTIFWLASITKCFTALAITQLVQRGTLAFTDTIGAHLTGFPAESAAVTVHQLLTHTSGVGRPALGSGNPAELQWNSFEEVMDGTLDIIRQTPLQFIPGTRYAYSNDGFFVLGAIVAQASGQSYFDYVREHVFRLAGMPTTDFYSGPQVLTDRRIARPYWTQPDGSRIDFAASPYAPFTTGPAGGAYTTASDLLAFARALTAGTLVAPAFTALLTGGKVALPASQPPSQAEFYGYGHLEAIVNNQLVTGNKGGGPGASTRLDVFPGRNWVSIVLSNYDTTINPIVQAARNLITD